MTPSITPKLIIVFIIIPLGSIIANTFFFYSIADKQAGVVDIKSLPDYWILIAFPLIAAPTVAFAIGFGGTYVNLSQFRKSNDEITVSEFQYIRRFVYIEIILAAVLIFIFYAILSKNILPQISIDWLTLWFFLAVITPLLTQMYISFEITRTPDPKSEFGFHFARKSMIVLKGMLLEGVKDEVKKVQFLMMALKWYNKFIKKNLNMEFDAGKICSSILVRNDKKQALDELVYSFEIDYDHKLDQNEMELLRIKPINDLLKPINCLSKIANLPSSESFLKQKKLTTNIKEVALILAAVIPVVITVLQLILAFF